MGTGIGRVGSLQGKESVGETGARLGWSQAVTVLLLADPEERSCTRR